MNDLITYKIGTVLEVLLNRGSLSQIFMKQLFAEQLPAKGTHEHRSGNSRFEPAIYDYS